MTGQPCKTLLRRAITADACDQHASIRDRTGGTPIKDPRKRKAPDRQTTIFDALTDEAA